MRGRSPSGVVVLVLLGALAACSGGGHGGGGGSSIAPSTSGLPGGTTPASTGPVLSAVPGNGPRVIFDEKTTLGDPAPSPFPNDLWTVRDPSTPTGKRVALPFPPQTKLEKQLDEGLSSLDGFGTTAPIMIHFDGPVDLATIKAESVLVVNVEKSSPHFGRAVPLDIGATPAYPVDLESPHAVFTSLEPNANAGDYIFKPGNRRVFYEDETDTLILRPLVPLDEACEHAVVLMTGMKGTNGDAVRPPVQTSIIGGQAPGVGRALDAVKALHLKPSEVSFAFTFTTQSITAVPFALAEGLHGRGPFASLATQYPPRFGVIDDSKHGLQDGDPHTFDVDVLRAILTTAQPIAAALAPTTSTGTMFNQVLGFLGSGLYDFDSVKYLVTGSYQSPSFIKGGGVRFDVSIANGTAKQVPDKVTFLAAIPRPTAANGYAQPPYPVVVFAHGNDRARIDAISIATEMARAGYATITIDAYGHGPDDALSHLPPMLASLAQKSTLNDVTIRGGLLGLAAVIGATINPLDPIDAQARSVFGHPTLAPLTQEGRAIDVDGDGYPDSGKNFYSTDPTVTRDIIRQTALDYVQLCRILKACGTDVDGSGHLDREEGDFHQTGVSDLGGPNVPIYFIGQSLGSLVGAQVTAIAPEIEAAVLNAAGSGLNDINQRSSFHGVTDRLARVCFGIAVHGRLDAATGEVAVSVQVEGNQPPAARLKIAPGSAITLTNTTCSVAATTSADTQGQFYVPIKADPGDALSLEVKSAQGVVQKVALTAPIYPLGGGGLGVNRNTPQWRRYVYVGTHIVDGAEPVNFATHWRTSPLAGRSAKRVLLQCSRNDWTVPIAGGVNLARAAGFLSPQRDQLLRQIGLPYGRVATTVNVDRDYPVESTQDFGVRFFCVDKHEFLNVPTSRVKDGYLYSVAAQEQATGFFKSGAIDDSFPILKR